MRAVVAVEGEHRVGVGGETTATFVQRLLKLLDDCPRGAFAERRGLRTVTAQSAPRSWTDDPIDGKVGVMLELLNGLSPGAEVKLDDKDYLILREEDILAILG